MYQQGAGTRNFINTRLLKHYGKLQPLSATQFIEIWNHYDKNASNYLENEEIDAFLFDFLNSSLSKSKVKITQMEAKELKAEFLKEFDQNQDGKISITELSYILPARQRFYLLYRLGNGPQSHGAKDYMQTWKKYDKNLSGFIEIDELKSFLGDLLAKVNSDGAANEKKLERYTQEIMQIFDINKDGKLELSELVHLLPREENFVQIVLDKALTLDRLYGNDVKLLIEHYDKDNSGTLEAEELDNLLRDVLVASQSPGKEISSSDVQELKASLMKACDLDANGRLNGKELSILLLAIANSQRSGYFIDRELGEAYNEGLIMHSNDSTGVRYIEHHEEPAVATDDNTGTGTRHAGGSDESPADNASGDEFVRTVRLVRKDLFILSGPSRSGGCTENDEEK